MKETLIYDMYQYLGADASLYNYAKLSVNGAYWGLYTAVEAVEDSFLLRNYGVSSGKLYKPDSMNLGDAVPAGFADNANSVESFSPPQLGGAGFGEPDFQPSSGAPSVGSSESGGADAPSAPGMPAPEGGNFDSSSVGGLFGKFSASGGADLNYTDDDLDSYSTIWEGEITSTGKADRRRAVTALKNISQGVDLEKYMDIDNLLRYMAVDASHIDLNTMGSMDTGGGGPTPGNLPKGQESFVPQNTGEENSGVTLPPQPDGEGTEFGAFQPDAQPPESTFPSAPSEVQQSEASAGQPETGAFPTPESGANFPNFPGFAGTDSGQPPFDGTSLRGRAVGKDSPDTRNALVTYGIYLGIMLVALAFAKLYSRKPRRR